MEKTSVQKLAAVLRVLVIIVFVCNLIALLLVPGVVGIRSEPESWWAFQNFLSPYEGVWETPAQAVIVFFSACWQYLFRVWRVPNMAILTLFLWACGICTAAILWQAKKVLDSIMKEESFTLGNARCLMRAAVCCFVISGAALARTVWGLIYYHSTAPLFTYNTLFVPVFLLAGLVCMVMSALFRQAAELKAENDLTI